MLAELFIIMVCTGTPGNYSSACSKAGNATVVQFGIKNDSDRFEKAIYREISYVTGDTILSVGGFAVKAIKDREIKYKMQAEKNFLDVDYVTPGVEYKNRSKGVSLNFGWAF